MELSCKLTRCRPSQGHALPDCYHCYDGVDGYDDDHDGGGGGSGWYDNGGGNCVNDHDDYDRKEANNH